MTTPKGNNGGNGNGPDRKNRLRRVQAAIDTTRQRYSGADAFIYFGNLPAAYPSALLRDPFLKPTQMVLYLILLQQLRGQPNSGGTSYARIPDPKAIQHQLKIGSRTTLAFCFKMLRATRWLSLLEPQGRDEHGRYAGNLYVLHGEPCSLEDASHLDQGYMALVESLAYESNRRTRQTGQAILAAIDTLLAQRDFEIAERAARPIDPEFQPLPLPLDAVKQEFRLESLAAAENYEQEKLEQNPGLFFGCQVDLVDLYESEPDSAILAENDSDLGEKSPYNTVSKKWTRSENAEMAPCPKNGHGEKRAYRDQKMDTVPKTEHGSRCSSSFIDKKTTTTTPPYSPPPPSSSDAAEADFDWQALIYPDRLSPNEQGYVRRYLRNTKPELRQPVLDELSGRLRIKEKTGGRIHDPLAYLGRLVALANQGKLEKSSAAIQLESGRKREGELKRYEQESLQRLQEQVARMQKQKGEGEN